MFSSWIFYVCLFIVTQIVFLQTFKYVVKNSKSVGALTVLIQVISAISMLLLLPFFEWTLPSSADWWMWVLLGASFIFFAINDRLDATTRKHLDVSVDAMLHQTYRLLFLPLMVILYWSAGQFAWSILVGSIIIVFMNMLLLYDKGKFKFNKYVVLKLISASIFAFALSSQLRATVRGATMSGFAIPFVVFLSFLVPALLLAGVKQATPYTVVKEFRRREWWVMLICGVAQGLMTFALYMSLDLAWQWDKTNGMVYANAIMGVYVLLNAVFAFIFFKERKNLLTKTIAAAAIVGCIVLIAFRPF